MKPYTSIDIETTGIDDRSYILQIAAVTDNNHLKTPEELPTIDIVIKYDSIEYSEPYALGMNAELFKKMMNKDFPTVSPSEAVEMLLTYLTEVAHTDMDDRKPEPKIIFAGKNVASFDIPKLRKFVSSYGQWNDVIKFDKLTHYKTLDVGSIYFDEFEQNASLSKINELTGRNQVSHNALDDALDVVYAIRHKLATKRNKNVEG
jgi:oligoribonuclease (3'-5' exoribonuclease)